MYLFGFNQESLKQTLVRIRQDRTFYAAVVSEYAGNAVQTQVPTWWTQREDAILCAGSSLLYLVRCRLKATLP